MSRGGEWRLTESVETFAAHAYDVLAQEPERQTVALSAVESLRGGVRWGPEPPVFGWYDGGSAFAAAVLTPPYPLLLTAVPDGSADELADAIRLTRAPIAGVNGDRSTAEAFATAWTCGSGAATDVFMEQRLYRLDDRDALVVDVPGNGRRATVADGDLVVRWYTAFATEATPGLAPVDHSAVVRHRLTAGLIWLWEHDGVPVAVAGRNPIAAGVARIGPVYTPDEHRRRGYGAAVTAACATDALAHGARGVVLFTDLANPTTNAIYQTIGFRPVEDRVVLRFVSS